MKFLTMLLLAGISGCACMSQRFVPLEKEGDGVALDTKTGQECLAVPKEAMADPKDTGHIPFCYDLYTNSNES